MSLRIDRFRWIAGSPCSGKSTLAQALAIASSATFFACDDAFDRHARTVSAERGPTLKKVTMLSVERRLAQRVDLQVEDVFRLGREQWPQILGDLDNVAGNVVVEGAALLPEQPPELGVTPDRALWVVPTETFQWRHYARRVWAQEVARQSGDPDTAFERWMQRDARFAAAVATQARQFGFRVLMTGDDSSVEGHRAAAAAAQILQPFS